MIVTIIFLLLTLSWATWLFSGAFKGKQRFVLFLFLVSVSSVASFVLYNNLGASKELKALSQLHQALEDDDLETLLEKTATKKISLDEFFSEMRLRSELNGDDKDNWMLFGRLLLESEQKPLAAQAFQRAINLGDNTTLLEVAQNYIEKKEYKEAIKKVDLVLLDKPTHEGAMLMQGLANFKLENYQDAIDSWTRLLKQRPPNSDSAKIIQQQIDNAKFELDKQQNNSLKVVINNFDSLDLQPFSKAFVLIRKEAAGAPIAVKSIDITNLKSSVTIGPDNLMLTSNGFWQLVDIYIEIRLSQSGFAKPQKGDLYGKTEKISSISPESSFNLVLNQTVK